MNAKELDVLLREDVDLLGVALIELARVSADEGDPQTAKKLAQRAFQLNGSYQERLAYETYKRLFT